MKEHELSVSAKNKRLHDGSRLYYCRITHMPSELFVEYKTDSSYNEGRAEALKELEEMVNECENE
jgi:hypothetical protein